MQKVQWFVYGFLTAQVIYLLTTTTPARAVENLRDWLSVIWR